MTKFVRGVLFGLLCCAGTLRDQVTTVTDWSGALVPSAKAALIPEETGATSEKTSDASGDAVFSFLREGLSTIRAEPKEFKRRELPGFELSAGQQVRSSFALEIGAATETFHVDANVPLIDTASPEQIDSFEAIKVRDLPLARRQFPNLPRLGTGVVSTGDGVRRNGAGENEVAFSVDGTDAGGNPEGPASSGFGRTNLIDTRSTRSMTQI